MNAKSKKIALKLLKISGITFGSVIALMFLMPILFPGTIAEQVKAFANRKLNGELNFKEAKLSFFNHFPSLTLTLTDFSLKGSAPYKDKTLLVSDEVAFGINLASLVTGEVNIDEIFISNADMNVLVNEKGEANYNVYVSDKKKVEKDSSSVSLRLDKILIENSHLVYNDQSAKILMDAKGFNYRGKGDLDKAIFDLKTKMDIDSFDFIFNGEEYLKDKKVNADLLTQINTNSLSFIFQDNNLIINKLPIDFKGQLDFLKSGYDIDINLKSEDSELHDFFTAMPPHYVKWLEKTQLEGKTDLLLTFKGRYNVAENKKPDLAFNMKVRDGYVAHNQAQIPASNIYLNFETKLPSLNTDKLNVKVDSLFFNLGKDYFSGIVETNGIESPNVKAKIKSQLDLGKLHRALGIQNMDFKGVLNADINMNGVYNKEKHFFPVTKGNLVLQHASLKTDYYPNPIENINLTASVLNTSGKYKDLTVRVKPAQFVFEGKPVFVDASFTNFDDILYDINAKGEVDLARIYKVFSRNDLDVKGYVKADLTLKGRQSDATNGNYNKLNNKGTLVLRDIHTKSDYLPKPFVIKEGVFTFHQNNVAFRNFLATYGQSDFKMNGQMQNVINFIMSDKSVLKGNFKVDANYINVDEFMANASASESKTALESDTKKTSAETGVVIIPSNFDFNLTTSIKKINFEGLNIDNLNANLQMKSGVMKLSNTIFSLIGSTFRMDATYGSLSPQKAAFNYQIKAKDFNVKKAYNEIKMFRDMVSAAENAEGIVSVDYKIAGHLDGNMKPIYPSLSGGGVLSVRDVKMKGFKLFNTVSSKTGKDAVKDPNLKEIDIKTTVKNNIMNIERFKFKVAGFRPRIEGQASLDGKLNLKMRLGLPPFGIIGIPLKITGTSDNPKVKIGKNSEDLQEAEYEGAANDTITKVYP
ncbi:AsmA family protein [Flavobacterium pedocola]